MADSRLLNDSIIISGPWFHVDLAALDARHPIHYSDRLYIFRCVSGAQRDAQLDVLKTGLQGLLRRFPILGGTVRTLPHIVSKDGKQDWRTVAAGAAPALELIVRDLRSSIPSFEELAAAGFPPMQLPPNVLIPVPRDLDNERPFAACRVQFSAIEGGTILTYAMSHSVADGVGTNELTRVLSEEIRLASEGVASEIRLDADNGLDRSLLRGITSKIPFKIDDHPAYRLPASTPTTTLPLREPPPHPFTAPSPESPTLLRISPGNLAKLKADATLPGAPPISTHDALCALVWRTLLLIRSRRSAAAQSLITTEEGHMYFPADARRHLNLPQSYVGNAVYQLTASLPLSVLFSPAGLKEAASAIRKAISAVNAEKVESLMAETSERWLEWAFLSHYATTGVAIGTDWTMGELYGLDWGKHFGRMESYRYPGEPWCCILPKRVDGSADVVMSVLPAELEVLRGKEGFEKYLEK